MTWISKEQLLAEIDHHVVLVYGLRFGKPGHPHHGKIRYVGVTNDPLRRMKEHQISRQPVGASIRAHGVGCYLMVFLSDGFSECSKSALEKAFERERFYIKFLGTSKRSNGGLNCTLGGDGVVLVGEAREGWLAKVRASTGKLSKARKKKFREDPEYARAHAERSLKAARGSAEKRSVSMKTKWQDPAFRALVTNKAIARGLEQRNVSNREEILEARKCSRAAYARRYRARQAEKRRSAADRV